MLCFAIINSVLLNLLYVWISFSRVIRESRFFLIDPQSQDTAHIQLVLTAGWIERRSFPMQFLALGLEMPVGLFSM